MAVRRWPDPVRISDRTGCVAVATMLEPGMNTVTAPYSLPRPAMGAAGRRPPRTHVRVHEQPLDGAAAWIDERRRLWEGRLDRFERHIEHTKATT